MICSFELNYSSAGLAVLHHLNFTLAGATISAGAHDADALRRFLIRIGSTFSQKICTKPARAITPPAISVLTGAVP